MPTEKQKEELEALAAMPDDEIDFSDIPEITYEQWTGAVGRGRYKDATRESPRTMVQDLIGQHGQPGAEDIKWAERALTLP